MKFSGQFLNEETLSPVHEEIVDHLRWSLIKFVIIEYNGHYYGVEYEEGATEYQDVPAFESDEWYDLPEYHQVEVRELKWQKKEN